MEYGCIGEKLAHSFSKEIHNLLFDYEYEIKEIAKDELDEFMTRRNFKAINVTIPYKQDVIPYLDWISDVAKQIGAVNTIVNKDGKLYGYNTDFVGMTMLIEKNDIQIANKKVLVLGSGGTSKTAVAVANALGAESVMRVSRTAKEDCISYEDAVKNHSYTEVIINTTPCGMFPNIVGEPIDVNDFPKLESVVDAIYNPLCSNLVIKSKNKGLKSTGGLYMLVHQAAVAAELFTGKRIDNDEIYDVYQKIKRSKQNVVLVGMPSSGKTTIGEQLAKKLNRQFIDIDKEIETAEGKTIPQIFNESGERAFRDIESRIIAEISSRQNVVIATGGGAILREQNITFLKGNGKIYFIDRPIDLLITTDDRPLSSNRNDLNQRYKERYHTYCRVADKKIINDGEIDAAVCDIKDDFLR